MPPTTKAESRRYDKRRTIITLSDDGNTPVEIHRQTGYPESTIRSVIKVQQKRGHTHDLPRSGRPPVLNSEDKKKLEDIVEDEPASSLRKIAKTAGITCSPITIDKALKEANLTLHVKRPKPWIRLGHPERRLRYCHQRRHWEPEDWRRRVWTDESKIEYDPNPSGQKVRYKPGQQLNAKHLKPTFKSGRTSIQVWCAFQYGSKCDLVLVRQRTPAERTGPKDRLGMNGKQYAEEIIEAHLVPYWFSLDDPEGSYLIEDRDTSHTSQAAINYRNVYGIRSELWPPGSPDFNAIENVWKMLKLALKMRWSDREKRPHSAAELFTAAQEEWAAIPQWKLDLLVDSMPDRMEACIEAEGGHTKW